ncbi:MAG TPA: caspase family protein, partial [Aestuariivirga sp.]|nr:caspase family protein [Aestuariivirga sp.]
GFSVKELENAGRNAFEEALSNFSDEAVGADFAIVYFAGHGIEVDKQNYLIPIDATLATDRRLRFEAVSLDEVLGALDGVEGIRMVLLDACRNNPFAASMRVTSASRSIGRGLSQVEAPFGTVISYSAREGTVASDGNGRNSPFAAALLANITKPGLEIQFLLREVRDSVLTATHGTQEPFISASLGREAVYLVPPVRSDSQMIGKTRDDKIGEASELEFWQSVKDTSDPRLLKAYIDKFPNGTFLELATARIKLLETAPAPKKIKNPITAKPSAKTSHPKKTTPGTQQKNILSTRSCREGNKELCRMNCAAGVARACRKLHQLGG